MVRRIFAAYVSEPAERARTSVARALGGRTLTYFHEVGDPYSTLVAQRVGSIAARARARLDVRLVSPPTDDVAPDRERLDGYAVLDAERLARFHGLAFTPGEPSPATLASARRYIAAGADAGTRLARIERTREALWVDDVEALEALPGARASEAQVQAELREADAARTRAGHYLGAVISDGGEVYWGLDRLPHLERALGLEARPNLGPSPLRSDPDAKTETFFSFRSPYSYLAIARIARGPMPSRFQLRPVLPMVLRGLAVPARKRLYIVRDTAREARRHRLPFGFGVDPLGAVERCIAVFFAAEAQQLGLEFAESAMRAAFAEGVDLSTDAGLWFAARRVGLDDATVADALRDEGWRDAVEQNRQALLDAGLWGVPSFVRDGEAVWGQDRLAWLDPRL